MIVYLVQHGEAKSESEDPQRPLTEQAIAAVRRMAEWAARAGVKPDEIRHSGKLRASQTATIMAEYLSCARIGSAAGLAPNDDVRPLAQELNQCCHSLMIVGHLPFLSRLASYLLFGDTEHTPVRFQMGGIVCLERQEGRWCLLWAVTPGLVPQS